MKFAEIYTRWKAVKQETLKPSSLATYSLLAEKNILPLLGDKESVTEADARAVEESVLAAGGSKRTATDVSVLLLGILRFAAKEGWWPMPTWQTNGWAVKASKDLLVLSLRQEKIFLQELAAHPSPRYLGIFLALTAGLRLGEVCGLRWQDFDLENGYIHVRGIQGYLYAVSGESFEWRRKTDAESESSPRDVPLTPEQIAYIAPLVADHLPEMYFLTNTTDAMQPRTLRVFCTTVAKNLGLPAVTFKDLRHTFAVRCLESGVDFVTLAKLLGNDNVAGTVNTYMEFVTPEPRKGMQAMVKRLKLGD